MKDQVDTREDNKDVQLLKDEMWSRKITNRIQVFDGRKRGDENDIIKKIRKNNTREKEVSQAMKREDRLAWEEDNVVYMEGSVKNMDDGLQFLSPFSFYLLVFFISHLFSMLRTRVRV